MLSLHNLVSFTSAVDLDWDWRGHGGLPTGNPWIFSGVYFLHFSFQNKFKVLFSQMTDSRAVISGSEDALCFSGCQRWGPWCEQVSRVDITSLLSTPRRRVRSRQTKGKRPCCFPESQPQICTVNKEQVY